ncbi:MAG TPA: GNAT family N-acetyltransferase, partial [Paracoccaceae bacterium]|nr:GNAT family N-acetyltransferase [Paracoccaceae bacterium]
AGRVWWVVCSYLPPAHRGQGIARALLAAAAAAGRAAGCTWIESYAVPPGERPYAFLGSTAFYAREGFAADAPPGPRPAGMRRALG